MSIGINDAIGIYFFAVAFFIQFDEPTFNLTLTPYPFIGLTPESRLLFCCRLRSIVLRGWLSWQRYWLILGQKRV